MRPITPQSAPATPIVHGAVPRDRRGTEELALAAVADRDVPQRLAAALVERDEVAVGRAAHDLAVDQRHPAVDRERLVAVRHVARPPLERAGRAVDGVRVVRGRYVDDAGHDQRLGLERALLVELARADPLEPSRVGRRDLAQAGEARPAQVAVVRRPVGARPGFSAGAAGRRRVAAASRQTGPGAQREREHGGRSKRVHTAALPARRHPPCRPRQAVRAVTCVRSWGASCRSAAER